MNSKLTKRPPSPHPPQKNLIFYLNKKNKNKTFESPYKKKNQLLLGIIKGSEGGIKKGTSYSRRQSRRAATDWLADDRP